MLPIITEDVLNQIIHDVLSDVSAWRKKMIHYIKDENPEINSAILEVSNKTDLDPKAVATGAYVVYKLLENASDEQDYTISDDE